MIMGLEKTPLQLDHGGRKSDSHATFFRQGTWLILATGLSGAFMLGTQLAAQRWMAENEYPTQVDGGAVGLGGHREWRSGRCGGMHLVSRLAVADVLFQQTGFLAGGSAGSMVRLGGAAPYGGKRARQHPYCAGAIPRRALAGGGGGSVPGVACVASPLVPGARRIARLPDVVKRLGRLQPPAAGRFQPLLQPGQTAPLTAAPYTECRAPMTSHRA